jgi:hypothetical protein
MMFLLLLTLLVPIKASVYPQIALVNPYQKQTFRIRWQVEPHPDNRRVSIAFTCGNEVHSAQREHDEKSARTSERYVEMTVLEDCSFVACVVRVTNGKAITICDQAFVRTGSP